MIFNSDKNQFLQHFKKGDLVKSTWSSGRAFFVVGQVIYHRGSLYSHSSIGIDNDKNVRYHQNFGIEDNDIELMTPEEVQWFKCQIHKQAKNYNIPNIDIVKCSNTIVTMNQNTIKLIKEFGYYDGNMTILDIDSIEIIPDNKRLDILYVGVDSDNEVAVFASSDENDEDNMFLSWHQLPDNIKTSIHANLVAQVCDAITE